MRQKESAMSRSIRFRNAMLPVACVFAALAGPVPAAENPAVAAEVMAAARAQWAAQDQNKPAAQSYATVADDYTEFNAQAPVLMEGKALNGRFFDASLQGGDKGLVSEMLNPHVQVYGDTAILSYNYAGMLKDREGKIDYNFAKSTRVYVKQGGKWMLVHANFAPVTTPGD
jgi:ketosteroid isomerase-like protein